jgi:hypothetical protein
MKLIITEEQLRLIIEGERKLFTILDDIISQKDDGVDKIFNLFKNNKDTKNWVGIKVIGDIDLTYHYDEHLRDFCNVLVEVTGDLEITNRKGITFPLLEKVGGNLDVEMTSVKLPKLRYVSDNFKGYNSKINELPELEYVGGKLSLRRTNIKDLPKLKYVGDFFNIMFTPLANTTTEEELRNKIDVKGEIYL